MHNRLITSLFNAGGGDLLFYGQTSVYSNIVNMQNVTRLIVQSRRYMNSVLKTAQFVAIFCAQLRRFFLPGLQSK